MIKIELDGHRCLHCGHEWVPRIKDVRQCPKCKTARWDRPKREKKAKE